MDKSCGNCKYYKKEDQYSGHCEQILMSISNEFSDLEDMCVPANGFYCAEHKYAYKSVVNGGRV